MIALNHNLAPGIQVIQGDCLEVLPTLEADSVDSVVCDPPYGLGFMGKDWDHGVPGEHFWREVLRVAKPGAHLLAFGGTRTFHRLTCAIEDADWQIRDCVMWVYGSGFPKSLDVSKAIDQKMGCLADRKITHYKGQGPRSMFDGGKPRPASLPASLWQGWGTALKPAWEPIIVARKPLQGTVAENVLKHGTGAINVDGCRIKTEDKPILRNNKTEDKFFRNKRAIAQLPFANGGRWPANLIHDGSEEVVGLFPVSDNGFGSPTVAERERNKGWCNSSSGDGVEAIDNYGDTGSAARFFYTAKASKEDRDEGCEGLEAKACPTMGSGIGSQPNQQMDNNKNSHPTVKPTDLMRYLCRLVTRPKGIILDPFMGSGSTGKAAILEDCYFIGIEIDLDYCEIACCRLEQELVQGRLDLTG